MTTKNKTLASDKVQTLIQKLLSDNSDGGHADVYDVLHVLGTLFDLLSFAKLTGEKKALIALANFIAATADIPWQELDFDVRAALKPAEKMTLQYGASEANAPGIVLEALTALTDLLVDGAVVAGADPLAADIFNAVVAGLAENSNAPPAPAISALPPEIYSPSMVKRVFTPAPFSLELAGKLQMMLVHYEGIQGNDMRALAFDNPGDDEEYLLFLETGECLEVKKNDCSLAVIDAESYENVSAALLAFIVAAVPELEMCEVIRPDTARAIEAGALGEFTTDICTVTVRAEDLQPLTHVIDTAREASSMGMTGATGPVGALLRFPVPNVPGLLVVLEAQVGAAGPYVLARLVDSSSGVDRVLMRLDQPRQDAVKGLYLFPHLKQAVVLKA